MCRIYSTYEYYLLRFLLLTVKNTMILQLNIPLVYEKNIMWVCA